MSYMFSDGSPNDDVKRLPEFIPVDNIQVASVGGFGDTMRTESSLDFSQHHRTPPRRTPPASPLDGSTGRYFLNVNITRGSSTTDEEGNAGLPRQSTQPSLLGTPRSPHSPQAPAVHFVGAHRLRRPQFNHSTTSSDERTSRKANLSWTSSHGPGRPHSNVRSVYSLVTGDEASENMNERSMHSIKLEIPELVDREDEVKSETGSHGSRGSRSSRHWKIGDRVQASSRASSHATGRVTGTTLEKFLAKISFPVLVAILMCIPAVLLVTYSSLHIADEARALWYERKVKDYLKCLGNCESAANAEAMATTLVLTRNSTLQWDVLQESRLVLDALEYEMEGYMNEAPDGRLRSFTGESQDAMNSVVVVRYLADNQMISTREVRNQFRQILNVLGAGRSIVTSNPSLKKSFSKIQQLKFARVALNGLSECSSVGAEMLLRYTSNQASSHTLVSELAGCREVFVSGVRFVLSIASEGTVYLWAKQILAHRAVEMLNTLYANSIQAKPQLYEISDWMATFSLAMGLSSEIDADLLEEVDSSSRSSLIVESLKVAASIIGCAVAAGLILWSNMKTQKRMDQTLRNAQGMASAVQMFVPRAFLRLCGCTSILHVSAGDSTQVATTLLFSDIRNFTGLSEMMTNEHLFSWLQEYFDRMTHITEGNHGFIDKFIGDAISSIFTSATNAVKCGIEMHTNVGQLNLDYVSSHGKNLIRIGVGIHHAVVCAGFLGDEDHLTVALISPEVNIAQQLEGITKKYGARILISQTAIDQINDMNRFEHRKLGRVVLPGTPHPVSIVEVYQPDGMKLKNYKTESKQLFERGVKMRESGNIVQSNVFFEQCQTMERAAEVEDPALDVKLSQTDASDFFD